MRLFACLIVAPQRGYDEPAILSYAISSFCPTSADGLQLGLCSFSCTATSRHGSGRAVLSTRVAVRSAICGPSTTSWPSTHSSKRAASGLLGGEGDRRSPGQHQSGCRAVAPRDHLLLMPSNINCRRSPVLARENWLSANKILGCNRKVKVLSVFQKKGRNSSHQSTLRVDERATTGTT